MQAYCRARHDDHWTHDPANAEGARVIMDACPAIMFDDAREMVNHMLCYVEEWHREWFWCGIDGARHFNWN